MAQAFTPALEAKRISFIRRTRALPLAGQILVKVGEQVEASQVVARAELPGDLHILRIAEKLSIEPFEVLKGLKVKVGQVIRTKQLICSHAGLFGLFKSNFFSPADGVIELINERTGHLALRSAAKPIEVDAYARGQVVGIEGHKAVNIEIKAAFIQGIFGLGGERRGILRVLRTNKKSLEVSDLPADFKGTIIVSRYAPNLDVIKRLSEGGARGLIVGSADDKVLAGFLGYDLGIALTGDEDIPLSLILTEGFGSLEMSVRTFELLASFDGQLASINGATQVRAGAVRPEIIIPHDLPTESDNLILKRGLEVGAKIRIIRVPHFGKYAEVVELPSELYRIETGAMARVLKARIENGELVIVPRANIELLA